MKNSAIRALIVSNFSKCNPNDIIETIDVEFLVSYGASSYQFEVDIHSKINQDDVFTRLEVFLDNHTKDFEGDYCIDSENIRKMLEIQYNRGEILHEKIFASAPGHFSYTVTENGETEEKYIKVHIKELERNVYPY